KDQVPIVGERGLPFFQTHAVCTLGEVVTRLSGREAAVAAPAYVPPPVDDEGEASEANALAPRQILGDAKTIASVGASLGSGLESGRRPLQADATLERPCACYHGPGQRPLGFSVDHQPV